MSRRGRVRRRIQPAAQPFEIEHLAVAELGERHGVVPEKALQLVRRNLAVVHLGVIGAVRLQQLFVPFEKRGTVRQAVVPDQRDGAAGLQNPLELRPRRGPVEPVERLRADDRSRGVLRQSGLLGRTFDRPEAGVSAEFLGRRCPHVRVRFHRRDAAAPLQQKLGEDARARSDVRNLARLIQPYLAVQIIERRLRIIGTVFDIGFYPFGKTLFAVHAPSRSFPLFYPMKPGFVIRAIRLPQSSLFNPRRAAGDAPARSRRRPR